MTLSRLTGGSVLDQQRIAIGGVGFDPLDDVHLAAHLRAALAAGLGGWATVPDLDILIRAADDVLVRGALATADLVVASGTTLAVAARLAGAALPSSSGPALIWSALAGLRADGRSVYLLGGEPETPGCREGAHRAAAIASFACPGITIAGHASPAVDTPAEAEQFDAICREIVDAAPDVVLTGLDLARQAWFATHLRRRLPRTWFLGMAGAIEMMVGTSRRRRELRPTATTVAKMLARAAARR
jgi:N-acetylglucosaminyldiphosphoundecaprenol N-acetyl-beta-D-mannosaminyltransferase